MGLIGRVFGAIIGMPTASDRALLDTLCLAAAADGDVSKLELGYALEIALDLPGFERVSKKTLRGMLAERVEELQAGRAAGWLERIAASTEPGLSREQAYTLAVVIQHVDGRVTETETEFLKTLRERLGIAEARGKTILGEVARELEQAKRANLMNG